MAAPSSPLQAPLRLMLLPLSFFTFWESQLCHAEAVVVDPSVCMRAPSSWGSASTRYQVLAKSRGGSIVNMAPIASKRGVHNGEKLVAAGPVNMQGPSSPPPVQQRLGEPIDIANLVLFLASDESKFIAEQEFIPDSGISAVMAPFPS